MDPTSLPTDNLYKFMALAGLMLAGFCGWLRWKFLENQHAELATIKQELSRIEATTDVLVSRIHLLKDSSVRFGQGADEATNEGTNAYYAELLKGASQKIDETLEEQQAAHVAAVNARGRLEAVNARQDRYEVAVTTLTYVAALGLVTSACGFGLWYVNLQWYTDRQTKADFEDHMQELAAKRITREKAAHEAKP